MSLPDQNCLTCFFWNMCSTVCCFWGRQADRQTKQHTSYIWCMFDAWPLKMGWLTAVDGSWCSLHGTAVWSTVLFFQKASRKSFLFLLGFRLWDENFELWLIGVDVDSQGRCPMLLGCLCLFGSFSVSQAGFQCQANGPVTPTPAVRHCGCCRFSKNGSSP